MTSGRKAAARFFFHGEVEGADKDALGNHWFNVGDDVPAEVVSQVGSHLFEDEPEQEDEKPKTRVPRQRKPSE